MHGEQVSPIAVCLMRWLRLHYKVSHQLCARRKKVSVEEQRAQIYDRFSRGGKLHTWSMSIYEPLELMKLYKSIIPAQYTLTQWWCQDFDARWDQDLLSASEIPMEMVLEGLYKSNLQDYVQLQTVLAMGELENIRNTGQTSCSSLKTTVGDMLIRQWRQETSEPEKGDSCSFLHKLASGNRCGEERDERTIVFSCTYSEGTDWRKIHSVQRFSQRKV